MTPTFHQCAHSYLKDELLKLAPGEMVTVGKSTFENAFSEPPAAMAARIAFVREFPGWRVLDGPGGSFRITRPWG